MSEVPQHNYEKTEDLETEVSPEGASPWLVAQACREILQENDIDVTDDDVQEALEMIINAQDPEIAITTAITTFEGLDLKYEGLFVLLAEKGIIIDAQ